MDPDDKTTQPLGGTVTSTTQSDDDAGASEPAAQNIPTAPKAVVDTPAADTNIPEPAETSSDEPAATIPDLGESAEPDIEESDTDDTSTV